MRANVEHYQYLAGVYRLFFRDYEGSMRAEGARLTAVLHSLGTHTVLDACSGTGRQSIPMAEAGFSVVAADPCPAMQAQAQRLAAERGLSIVWLLSDFESLPLSLTNRFDAVIALGNGLCHCPTRDAVLRALVALRHCCAPAGVCLIGIKDFDRIRRERLARLECDGSDSGDFRSELTQTWEYRDPVLVCRTTLWRRDRGSGRVQTAISAWTREYMLGVAELRLLAAEAGFRSVERVDISGEAVYLLRV